MERIVSAGGLERIVHVMDAFSSVKLLNETAISILGRFTHNSEYRVRIKNCGGVKAVKKAYRCHRLTDTHYLKLLSFSTTR